jgi:hypothetical protein
VGVLRGTGGGPVVERWDWNLCCVKDSSGGGTMIGRVLDHIV